MKTYLIFKKLIGGFRISDLAQDTETENIEKYIEVAIRKLKETYNYLHPVTRKYGEVSDITFSEIEKVRNSLYFSYDYSIYGCYTVTTNKLLSILDAIIERYNFIKSWGFNFSQLIYLINDISDVLRTDFKELERKTLLQLEGNQ